MGKRVVELGCGLGLPGIVAALSGARRVLLTDKEHTGLRLALTSAKLNGLNVSTTAGAGGETIAPLSGSRLFPIAISAGVMLDEGSGPGFEAVQEIDEKLVQVTEVR